MEARGGRPRKGGVMSGGVARSDRVARDLSSRSLGCDRSSIKVAVVGTADISWPRRETNKQLITLKVGIFHVTNIL